MPPKFLGYVQYFVQLLYHEAEYVKSIIWIWISETFLCCLLDIKAFKVICGKSG